MRPVLFGYMALVAVQASPPTFYRDILPLLQDHCQSCHRQGQIAPMSLMTYRQVRPYASAIRERVRLRTMPPWFATPGPVAFANDPSLSAPQIERISAWIRDGCPPGDPGDAPPVRQWTEGWQIGSPDLVLTMRQPISLPATGDVDYQYVVVPTQFKEDKWVRMAEVKPSNRAVVHHAVVYIRRPGSPWLRQAPVGVPFTASTLFRGAQGSHALWTDSDVLLVYTPGSSPDQWPARLAKFVPAGADLIFQMHYTTSGHATHDQTSLGLIFSSQPPEQRVLTLQLTNDRFVIPPNVADHRVSVRGTMPGPATLLSLFPHMHLRGKSFQYFLRPPGQPRRQLLLDVPRYDFAWQLTYRLAHPIQMDAGTELTAVAIYDNSRNNPRNPDPEVAVRWGEQSWEEMMVGFFDVAVDRGLDKPGFFSRRFGAGATR